jgi:hypothetical protein
MHSKNAGKKQCEDLETYIVYTLLSKIHRTLTVDFNSFI